MKQYKSLMSNVGVVDGRYAARFIHAAIKSVSKKKGTHMQALECRLWLVGMAAEHTPFLSRVIVPLLPIA